MVAGLRSRRVGANANMVVGFNNTNTGVWAGQSLARTLQRVFVSCLYTNQSARVYSQLSAATLIVLSFNLIEMFFVRSGILLGEELCPFSRELAQVKERKGTGLILKDPGR